jgi:hypothetical protein
LTTVAHKLLDLAVGDRRALGFNAQPVGGSLDPGAQRCAIVQQRVWWDQGRILRARPQPGRACQGLDRFAQPCLRPGEHLEIIGRLHGKRTYKMNREPMSG